MLVRKEYDTLPDITPEQVELLKRAEQMPITFDEDSPELTDDELKEFHRVNNVSSKEKHIVALHLPSKVLQKA